MTTGFSTPWKTYTSSEVDRFDVDEHILFIPRDRSCAFIANRRAGGERPPHQANEHELHEIFTKHHLTALLPVFRRLRT